MKEETPMFRILDLFSGAGGMSYGMEKMSISQLKSHWILMKRHFRHLSTICQIQKLYAGILQMKKIKAKVIELCKAKKVNMIIGGPPCQGFSLKGKKLGLDDPRNFSFQ